jgi:lysophospholipase L1-like esterase
MKRLWQTQWLQRLACIVGGSLLALLLGEGLVQLLAPQSITPRVFAGGSGYLIRPIPHAKGEYIFPEFRHAVQINSKGLRDVERPYRKPKGAFRILGLGDSFTFGLGVAASDSYLKVLEHRLRQRLTHRSTDVINAGVPAWGGADELIFLMTEGVKYQPDLVLLAFHDNDLWDTWISQLVRLEEGRLVCVTTPAENVAPSSRVTRFVPFYPWLAQRSHLLNLVRNSIVRLAHRRQQCTHEQSFEQNEEGVWALTFAVMQGTIDTARAHGAQIALIYIPGTEYASPSTLADYSARLQQFAKKHHVPFLNLVPVIHRHGGVARLYYPRDGHWTHQGHQVAAMALEEFLIRHRLLPPPESPLP